MGEVGQRGNKKLFLGRAGDAGNHESCAEMEMVVLGGVENRRGSTGGCFGRHHNRDRSKRRRQAEMTKSDGEEWGLRRNARQEREYYEVSCWGE